MAVRDKTRLDLFWLQDKSLADLDNLPDPDEPANDIIENLEAAAESFREMARHTERERLGDRSSYIVTPSRRMPIWR